ncbi:restriction endonuclease subunit S [Streptomyces sp. B1866]|uniref:restriction endonuclease subunit S n=1 Tax=Streptomyces sp. B1866 TaxID=3075431 RepID=UPI00288E064E|nr:restriction endonuclease subunit S [Streptomyces sp. B1866]MDT3400187.1 restriction endonuclease subunit S [Streptomyces sp. B1866]
MSAFTCQTLADVVVDAKPGFACGEEDPNGVFQVRMNNVSKSGELDLTKKRYVPADHKAISKTLLRSGDVLFNSTNSPELVGKTLLVSGLGEPAVFSNHFLRLRVDEEQLDANFLFRWLQSQFQRGLFKSMCKQWVNQATVSRDALLGLRVPVPPLAEQRRIAHLLNHVDALRVKRREAITFLDGLSQSIFLDMFGDPKSNPMNWPVCKLSAAAAEFRYGTSKKSGPHGYPTLRIPNIVGGALNLSEIKTVEVLDSEFQRLRLAEGDLLFVRTNGNPDYVGRCATFCGKSFSGVNYRQGEFIFASYLIRVRLLPGVLHPIYVREYLLSPAGRAALRAKSKTSAGQYNINIQGLGAVSLMRPPVELQKRFTQRVKAIEELKQSHSSHLAALDALFATFQHRAFRGELRTGDAASVA